MCYSGTVGMSCKSFSFLSFFFQQQVCKSRWFIKITLHGTCSNGPQCTVFVLFDLLCVRALLLSHSLAQSGKTWPKILCLALVWPSQHWIEQVCESLHRSLICCINCPCVCPFVLLAEYHINSSCFDFSEVKKTPFLWKQSLGKKGSTVNVITGREKGSYISA